VERTHVVGKKKKMLGVWQIKMMSGRKSRLKSRKEKDRESLNKKG